MTSKRCWSPTQFYCSAVIYCTTSSLGSLKDNFQSSTLSCMLLPLWFSLSFSPHLYQPCLVIYWHYSYAYSFSMTLIHWLTHLLTSGKILLSQGALECSRNTRTLRTLRALRWTHGISLLARFAHHGLRSTQRRLSTSQGKNKFHFAHRHQAKLCIILLQTIHRIIINNEKINTIEIQS